MEAGPRRSWTEEHKKGKRKTEVQDTRRSTQGVSTTNYINNAITTGLTGDELRAELPTHTPQTPRYNRASIGSAKGSYASKLVRATETKTEEQETEEQETETETEIVARLPVRQHFVPSPQKSDPPLSPLSLIFYPKERVEGCYSTQLIVAASCNDSLRS